MTFLVECKAFVDYAGIKGENLEDMSLFCVCVAFSITKVERKAANY